ncbi:MAG: uridine kinase [Acidobacteria bacterium]|nr:MAG: uridine kinase [Acidobacteriota bacterium]
MLIIGIAGGTGSGKTTFAETLRNNLRDADLALIKHDSYYEPQDHLSFEERSRTNYDHPDSLETSKLIHDLMELKCGREAHVPVYDFSRHTRSDEVEVIKPSRAVIVEGILIFVSKELRDLFDMKIFIDTDADDRIIRRIRRDMIERGRDLDSILNQYHATVKPMHLEFVEPSKRWADLIIPRGGRNRVGLDLVSRRLHMLLEREYPESLHMKKKH